MVSVSESAPFVPEREHVPIGCVNLRVEFDQHRVPRGLKPKNTIDSVKFFGKISLPDSQAMGMYGGG